MSHPASKWLFLFAVLVPLSPTAAQDWGTLRGKVVIRFQQPPVIRPLRIGPGGEIPDESLLVVPDGGLANAVVYVRSPNAAIHPDLDRDAAPQVTMTLKDSMLRPRIVPVWIRRQSIEFANLDVVSYNLNVQPPGDTPFNPLLESGDATLYQFHRQQTAPVPVNCTIHPWIRAYVLPLKHPYAAVTEKTGEFRLEKVPAGPLDFQLWHERYGILATPQHPKGRFTLNIQPGENNIGTILVER